MAEEHKRSMGGPNTQIQPCYIDRMPVELLAPIFVELKREADKDWEGHREGARDDAAVVFSLVSRRWRWIASITPDLWTRLHLSHAAGSIRALTWARVSNTRKLSLWIDMNKPFPAAIAVQQLRAIFPRISNVTIYTAGAPRVCRSGSPALGLDFLLGSLPDTIRRLRFCRLKFSTRSHLLWLLRRSQQLRSLDFSYCTMSQEDKRRYDEVSTPPEHWITLPELEELILPCNRLAEVIRRALLLPRLRWTRFCEGIDAWPPRRDAVFVHTPPSEERSLDLSWWRASIHQPGSLSLFPDIETLTVGSPDHIVQSLLAARSAIGYPLPDHTLSPNQWRLAVHVYLPRLRVLRMVRFPSEYLGTLASSLTDLTTFLAVRQRPIERITILRPMKEPTWWGLFEGCIQSLGISIEVEFQDD